MKKGKDKMKLENFKDGLFDLLNDSDSLDTADIDTDDRNSIFTIKTLDGSLFEIECRKISLKNSFGQNRLEVSIVKF